MALIMGVQYGTPITATGGYSSIPAGTILHSGNGIGITSVGLGTTPLITTNANHNLVTGDTIVISGTSSTPVLNGTYVVTVASATTFNITTSNITVVGGASGSISKLPPRTLPCDGASYSTGVYPTLFAVIGYSYGGSAGSFNVPDFRGRFLRGLDGAASVDPDKASRTAMNTGGNAGNAVGSIQTDQFKSHTHVATNTAYLAANGSNLSVPATAGSNNVNAVNYSGGNETRPVNAYVNYCIAY